MTRPMTCIALCFLLAVPAIAQNRTATIHEGLVELTVGSVGIFGNGFSDPSTGSCEYPADSGGEHLYLGGLWVGARNDAGEHRVSTTDQDANNLSSAERMAEFQEDPTLSVENRFRTMSSDMNDDDYHPDALAPTHIEAVFTDDAIPASGDHLPLGLQVRLRALAWRHSNYDDFVIFDYTIRNVSGEGLNDVHVGFFNDTTVGNTNFNDPYDPQAFRRWNYYDDLNGAWRPGDFASDPTLWMMHEHDADGDEGWAESWVGCRLLGTEPQVAPSFGQPPVSYNCWGYSRVPDHDDWYIDPGDPDSTLYFGKYQLMSNGQFDVGVTPDGDFTTPYNRVALLSTGPFPVLAAGDSVRVVFALVLGRDSYNLHNNSRLAKLLYDYGYEEQVSAADHPPIPGTRLNAAVPNPFNPQTELSFTLAESGPVRLEIFDLAGRRVRDLVDGYREAGAYETIWDGSDARGMGMPSSTYFVRLRAGAETRTQRIMLLR